MVKGTTMKMKQKTKYAMKKIILMNIVYVCYRFLNDMDQREKSENNFK